MSSSADRPLHFSILHRLWAHGWSQYVVTMGTQIITRAPSYLTHSLGDLADAAILVALGEKEVRFSFQDEPGEYRWILKDAGTNAKGLELLQVTILDFHDSFASVPDDAGTQLIDGVCAKSQFLINVRSVLREALAVNGEDGYREKTIDYDFPMEQLLELEKLTVDVPD